MRIVAAAATRTGIRERNEDSFGLFSDHGVVCLADGMGGLANGARASRAAVEAVSGWCQRLELAGREASPPVSRSGPSDQSASSRSGFGQMWARASDMRRSFGWPTRRGSARSSRLAEEMNHLLRSITDDLHQRVLDAGVSMGTTLTVVAMAPERMVVGHVGDCRAYRLRSGKLELLTQDHTLAAAHLRLGILTEHEYRDSGLRNVLYQCLGPHPKIAGDVLDIDLADGDVVTLLSDGVWAALGEELIQSITLNLDPQTAADSLVSKAIAGGSDDNCTAIVVHVHAVRPRVGEELPHSLTVSQLFRPFQDADLMLLAPYLAVRSVAEGETILREGETGHDMFIIERGAVEVTRGGQPLAQLGPGSHFGETPLPRGGPRTTSVQAVIPTRVLVLDCDYMTALEKGRPDLAARLMVQFQDRVSARRVTASPES